MSAIPRLHQTVIDTVDARAAAEFWRQLLGLKYRPGDEPPPAGEPDPNGADWLVLRDEGQRAVLAFQQTSDLVRCSWPQLSVPQQLHLDLTVDSPEQLHEVGERAEALGAQLALDRGDDPVEPLRVYQDLDGHPFCIFATGS